MAALVVNDPHLRRAVQELISARKTGDEQAAETADKKVKVASRKVAEDREEAGRQWIRGANLCLVLLGLGLVALSLSIATPWNDELKDTRRAAGMSVPISVGLVGFLGLLQFGSGGLLAYVRGKDKRISTSLTQVALWTLALAGGFVYFVILDVISNDPGTSLTKTLGNAWDKFPEEYLLLLGGPFAAAVLARISVGTKVDDGRLQKVEANQTKLRDVVTDDDGRGNLVDAQFLTFNLVALVYFVARLIQEPVGLPAIPPVLVGLTSVSALGYTAAKAAEGNQPIIRSVTRHLGIGAGGIRPGDLVEVQGANFIPPGTASEEFLTNLAVRFGVLDVFPELREDEGHKIISPTNTSLLVRVPETLSGETVDVSVITAAGAQSEPRQLTIIPDKPVITGIEPAYATPGQPLSVRGRYFRSPLAAEGDKPTVMFGDVIKRAERSTDNELSINVPVNLDERRVDLSIIAAGSVTPSDPVKLRLKPRPTLVGRMLRRGS
jgi:hypothetical protein